MSYQKDENLAYDYLNPVLGSESFVYCSSDPSFRHSYASETTPNSFTEYSDYQNQIKDDKLDSQFSSVPPNMFTSETIESSSKGYSRAFSGNDLLAENSVSGRLLRRFNSDLPTYCNYAIYDPFQGSPLEIANLSLLESRPVEETYQNNEALYGSELLQEEPSEAVQSKRTYKEVLTFPTQNEISSTMAETPTKTKPENEFRKESYKEKLLTTKLDPTSNLSKSVHISKSPLNNHHNPPSNNPKRPLKINNNLATGNSNKGSIKTPSEKNWHSVNESVRSVRSQTDLGGLKKKNRTFPIDGLSFELNNSPSEDESVTPIEVRSRDLKKNEKTKVKSRDKDTEKLNRRQNKKNNPPNNTASFARSFFPKVNQNKFILNFDVLPFFRNFILTNTSLWLQLARAFMVFFFWLYNLCIDVIRMSCNLTWFGLLESRKALWEKGVMVVEWIKIKSQFSRQYVTSRLPTLYETLGSFFRSPLADEGKNALGGLNSNIALPATGEEAMHRLLACKGRDPYSILGLYPYSFA